MTALIRSELVGLRTLRSTVVVPLGLFVLVGFIAGASLADAGSSDFHTPAQLREPVLASAGILVGVALSLFAASRVAGEFRFKTMAQRLLASPRRLGLLGAMLLTYGVFALLVGAVALGLGLGIAQPVADGKDLALNFTTQHAAGVLITVVLFTLIGVSVGVIFRSQPVAMVIIGGTFIAEKVIGIVSSDVTPYLPFGLLSPLLGLQGATISFTTAALTLTGITAVLAVVAAVLLDRRDVS